ncbi:MAG: D-alanyl-D-alanine carboxypeptidase family protein [Ornithinibacter sp.]
MRWAPWMRVTAGSAVLAAVVAATAGTAAAATVPTPSTSVTRSASPTPTPTPTPPSPSPTASTPTPSTSPSAKPGTSPSANPSTSTPPGVPPNKAAPAEGEPDHQVALSGALLAAQIAEADRIASTLSASNSKVAAATREMNALSDKSNALLESLVAARETERAATDEATSSRVDLAVLEARLATAHRILSDWVFSVYAGGGGDADLAGMLDALGSEPDQVGDPLGDLSYLTEQRTLAMRDIKVLTAEQVRLSAAADAAKASAAAATRVIQRDKGALDKIVLAQRSKMAKLRSLQVAEVEKAGPVASLLVGARTPAAKAAAQRLRDALSSASVDTTAIGKPCTNDSTVYPNGMIPPSGLCPIWQAPGESLSPAAAASFNAMSQAYAAQTGIALCITDSYRSLPDQISIKGKRGRFAATPGTSRHGLGHAVDLCGGVQDFGSPAHQWMRQNAPLYGWFHPSWAAAGGSLPEPWHWEFAG